LSSIRVKNVTRVGGKNAYRILLGNLHVRGYLEDLRRRWKIILKFNPKEIEPGWRGRLYSSLRIGKIRSFVNTNEPSGFLKYGENID
jgi:hypothetical protein